MVAAKRGDMWKMGRRLVLICAIAASILAAQFGTHPAVASAEAGEALAEEESVSRFTVYFPLYLVSGIYVYPVEYFVPRTESPARAAIEALIAGLPESRGLRRIPSTAKVLNLTIENRICTVDFSEDILQTNVGSGGEAALVNAIVYTLGQFPSVDKVRILVGGKPAETLAGHVDISGPLEPNGEMLFRGFEDSGQHWAGGAIMALQSMDILAGYEDGTVKPDRTLSRAEFVKMLVETLELPDAPDQGVPFADMETHWSRSHVQRALAAGLISASDYGSNFNPDGVIPREEMANLLAPARESYAAAHPDIKYSAQSAVLSFTDSAEVDARYLERVRKCAELGLLEGYPDGTFGPKRGLTRGEAATVLARMMGMRGAGTMVVVSYPEPGFKWDDGQFVILGAASAFEATVEFRFLGPGREVVYRDYTTSTLGMAWGAFGVSVDTSLFKGEPTLLEVFLTSMEDGSDSVVTGVPIERM